MVETCFIGLLFFRESPKNARGFPAKNELSGSPVDRLTSQSWRPQPSIRPAPAKGHVETLGDLGKDRERYGKMFWKIKVTYCGL